MVNNIHWDNMSAKDKAQLKLKILDTLIEDHRTKRDRLTEALKEVMDNLDLIVQRETHWKKSLKQSLEQLEQSNGQSKGQEWQSMEQ